MELRHLRYFVAVAEELHFGRAAERLCIAQPPLSQQIRQLEQEMGVTLLERTNRRVALTDAGRTFLEDARAVLARTESGVARARRVSRGEYGFLGVGFVGSVAFEVLPAVLRSFRTRFPDVELGLYEMSPSQQTRALHEGSIHIGFLQAHVAEGDIVQEVIARQPLVMVLPEDHPLAGSTRVSLKDFADEQFVWWSRTPRPSCGEVMLSICHAVGFEPKIVQEAQELQTVAAQVSAGIGVALAPAEMQCIRMAGVTYRPLVESDLVLEMSVVYRHEEHAPVLKVFLDTVYQVTNSRKDHAPRRP